MSVEALLDTDIVGADPERLFNHSFSVLNAYRKAG
jgi:hypothetical protein